jgi:hypothetical protein
VSPFVLNFCGNRRLWFARLKCEDVLQRLLFYEEPFAGQKEHVVLLFSVMSGGGTTKTDKHEYCTLN